MNQGHGSQYHEEADERPGSCQKFQFDRHVSTVPAFQLGPLAGMLLNWISLCKVIRVKHHGKALVNDLSPLIRHGAPLSLGYIRAPMNVTQVTHISGL